MTEFSKIQLQTSCILNVPLNLYPNDFSFIVNGKIFQTSRIISELLSPNIAKIHLIDPTINTYMINTKNDGDFSTILELLKFNQVDIPKNEIPFILEVIEILGNESIQSTTDQKLTEITVDNVFTIIKKYEQYDKFFSKFLSKEIDFISSHFDELIQTQRNQFNSISISTLLAILNSQNLQLESEDQLLKFVNELFQSDSKYSMLYEKVMFCNVSAESMKEFIDIFDFNEMTGGIWNKLSQRLIQKVEISEQSRYKKKEKPKKTMQFSVQNENSFTGIINYLKTKSPNNIENEIEVTSSSIYRQDSGHFQPRFAILYEDQNKEFSSSNSPNSWLRFDFKNHKVIPTDYTIKTSGPYTNGWRLKNWVIEASNDCSQWEIISEEQNDGFLNGNYLIHSYKIRKQSSNAFKYIQIRQTGVNWSDSNVLDIGSIEFYGELI